MVVWTRISMTPQLRNPRKPPNARRPRLAARLVPAVLASSGHAERPAPFNPTPRRLADRGWVGRRGRAIDEPRRRKHAKRAQRAAGVDGVGAGLPTAVAAEPCTTVPERERPPGYSCGVGGRLRVVTSSPSSASTAAMPRLLTATGPARPLAGTACTRVRPARRPSGGRRRGRRVRRGLRARRSRGRSSG